MGRATITANIGAGLYKVRLDYDLAAIDKELADLQAGADYGLLLAALWTRQDLAAARDAALEGLNAVVQQWIDALISHDNPDPPPIEPVNPESSVEEEQADALFAAINAERPSALTRSGTLDSVAQSLLDTLARNGLTRDRQTTAQRVVAQF